MNQLFPIELLGPREPARIAEMFGPHDEVHRLSELGIRVGAEVEMVRAGQPCILRVHGKEFCFRPSAAVSVLVTPIEVPPSCSAR